ncbi:MAG: hypothetical protein N2Z63_00915, partial [Thiobacillaceae bacterium]|nr:hypothetical protein [Thiobacillaceae bacterium]
ASVAALRWGDRDGPRLAAAANELRAILTQAQRLAVAKNREVCVRVQGGRLTLRLNPTPTAGAACSLDVVGMDGLPLGFELPSGATVTPAAFRYRADGQPQPAPARLALGPGVIVQVNPVTGHVQ